MTNRQEITSRWREEYKRMVEHDTWGQVEEAIEGYRALATRMTADASNASLRLSASDKDRVEYLVACLELRAKTLQSDCKPGISLANLQQLKSVFQTVLVSNDTSVPFDIPKSALQKSYSRAGSLMAPAEKDRGGTLCEPLFLETPGDEALSITVEKMGFKDATIFIDPFFTVSIVDKEGRLIDNPQDTPVMSRNKPNYVLCGSVVHIQTPLNKLPEGAAIFFEMKHFKPKKKKMSTKAWCLMEMDEIKPGPIVLEIYKKPTDLKRKALRLLSVKPLYLHLDLSIRTR